MLEYLNQQKLFLYPTPAGAYYMTSSPAADPARKLLRSLFHFSSTPSLNIDRIFEWTGIEDEEKIAELLKHMQTLGWLQGCDEAQTSPNGDFEDIIPTLLAPLSNRGNVLLADNLGFHIAYSGFNYETVEHLSALSADLSSLHERHSGLLEKNMGINSSAWAIVDASGNSQVGFWPIFIGKQRFVLAIAGLPYLNQPILTTLIWVLSLRYGEKISHGSGDTY